MCVLNEIETWRNKTGKSFGSIIFNLKKDPESVSRLEIETQFLDEIYDKSKISIQQRFYHVWFKSFQIENCLYCGFPLMFSKNPKFSIDRYGEKTTNPVNYYKTCMSESCLKEFNKDRTNKTLIEKY